MVKKALTSALIMLALGGCAATGGAKDPLESVNRKIFAFNDAADSYVFQPVARGYVAATPVPVRMGIGNFFANLEDAWIGVNNLIQGKPVEAASDVGRLLINSSIGILGLFDVATEIGLEKHDEDLGQTLGVWGVGTGPYLVLPLLGPSTVRDSSNIVASFYLDPLGQIERIPLRNSAKALKLVDTRAQLLSAGQALDDAALDKYLFMREFYLKRRRSQIFDGRPPREDDEDTAQADLPVTSLDNQATVAVSGAN